jgi:hypothetical protein
MKSMGAQRGILVPSACHNGLKNVRRLAANITDKQLQTTFLTSAAVREVLTDPKKSPAQEPSTQLRGQAHHTVSDDSVFTTPIKVLPAAIPKVSMAVFGCGG